jgi:hypothetical protein
MNQVDFIEMPARNTHGFSQRFFLTKPFCFLYIYVTAIIYIPGSARYHHQNPKEKPATNQAEKARLMIRKNN